MSAPHVTARALLMILVANHVVRHDQGRPKDADVRHVHDVLGAHLRLVDRAASTEPAAPRPAS